MRNKKILKNLYEKYGVIDHFESDWRYLENSMNKISKLWFKNLHNIKKVNLIILAEAPMWGENKKYFYNPKTIHTQFFYKSDFEYIINRDITNKSDLILELNKKGIIIVDFSPFPFNPNNTKLSYKRDSKNQCIKITKNDYIDILEKTFSNHLKPKINKIKLKSNNLHSIPIYYRYDRIKKNLNNTLTNLFLKEGLYKIKNATTISMNGGGIDKVKLKNILKV